MAISNYSDLKTSIANWLARDDLTTLIPDFIAIAENYMAEDLRIRAMETALSDTIASGVISVPTGYIELKNAYIDGTPTRWLQRKDPEWIYMNYPTRSADGEPAFIAREAENFIFGPYPDTAYTVKGIYYKKITALSDANTTNWFTNNAPQLVIYGALVEAYLYIQEESQAQIWKTRYDAEIKRIQDNDDREFLSGSTLTMTAG